MIDIIDSDLGEDLKTFDTQTSRGANILSVQLGSLEYAPDEGIDLEYFLQPGIRFQNASFKAYLIETLANRGVNVVSLVEILDKLHSSYIVNLSPEDQDSGMIAR